MGPETMLIGNVANLPKHAMLVLVAVAALHLHGVVALFLFPLFISLVVDYFVAVLVWVVFVLFVLFGWSIFFNVGC